MSEDSKRAAQFARMQIALRIVANWVLPKTDRYLDAKDHGDNLGREMSYEEAFGPHGAKEYLRSVAVDALCDTPPLHGTVYSKCHACGDEFVTIMQARENDDLVKQLRAQITELTGGEKAHLHSWSRYMLLFADRDRGHATFEDESEATAMFYRAAQAWTVTLYEAIGRSGYGPSLVIDPTKLLAKRAMCREHHQALQRIATALGLTAGANTHTECVPAIEKLVKRIADLEAATPKGSLYRHVKTRGMYHVIVAMARMEAEPSKLVTVYQNVNGDTPWVRPCEEFKDGRFELIESAAALHADSIEWHGISVAQVERFTTMSHDKLAIECRNSPGLAASMIKTLSHVIMANRTVGDAT